MNKQRILDRDNTTFTELPDWLNDIPYSYFEIFSNAQRHPIFSKYWMSQKDKITNQAELFLEHKFDLLGSGWVKVEQGMESIGFEEIKFPALNKIDNRNTWIKEHINPSNQAQSALIMDMIDHNYDLIDWQIDFKSGYRWNELQWYKDIQYGNILGADIKMPWELGRMQHLVILALTASYEKDSDLTLANKYLREFENQVLDFISTNPPRYGTQWMNAMEAAIRASNWLFAYDIFKSIGMNFRPEFEEIFRESIYEHAVHIVNNLEWSSGMRANHYLSNIVGLLFISAYLPISSESTLWLAFALQELNNEILYQFYGDGGNFEASTSYHIFSAEMIFWGYWIAQYLPPEKIVALKPLKPCKIGNSRKLLSLFEQEFKINDIDNKLIFSEKFEQRLTQIRKYSDSIIDSKGNELQIGDNDSGQFITFLKEILSQSIFSIEAEGIIEHIDFPDFGLYIYNKPKYQAYIRCGQIGQKGKGGHSHNDQLSFLLKVNGFPVFVDPGTYVYTAHPKLRNQYRSTSMHNTLSISGMEQNLWYENSKDDLFWIAKNRAKAKVIKQDDKMFIGEHFGFGEKHSREIKFDENMIKGHDKCEANGEKIISFHLHPGIKHSLFSEKSIKIEAENEAINLNVKNGKISLEEYFYSPEYGIKQKSTVIKIKDFGNEEFWNVEIYSLIP
jgi:hypothetical protein